MAKNEPAPTATPAPDPATTPENAAPASARKKRRAPGPVPASEIPMCWVTDADSGEDNPYLVNVADVVPGKHTRLE